MPSARLLMGLTVVEGCTGRVVWRSYSRWGKAQEGIGRECVLCGPEQSGGWAVELYYLRPAHPPTKSRSSLRTD
jgi:hypothetical protein